MALQDTLDQLQGFDFNDLDVSNIGSWPGPVKIIILILTLALVLGGGYWGYLTSIQDQLQKAEAKETRLRAEYEDKAGQAANLDAYLRQKKEMEETFGALLKQLPSDTEVPGLVEDITRTAIDNELTIESIELLSEIRTEFYVELPIQVVVEGTFHKIGSFVSGVAALPRIVTLHDFDIKPESSDQHLRMSITAKTYRYLGEDE
jgi:type IV pilus assembly protein PilO